MWNNMLLVLIGLAAGCLVSAGIFAFLTAIGLLQRLAAKTCTASKARLYEDCIVLGGTFGNLLFLYELPVPGGAILAALAGLCYGIFIGCLVMSLAETLDAFPILCRRLRLSCGLPWLIVSLALGKSLGSFLYYWFSVGSGS